MIKIPVSVSKFQRVSTTCQCRLGLLLVSAFRPNAKPREGSSNAEDDSQATFTLRVLELLGDTEVVSKIKRALYPDDLMAEIKELRAEITQLRSVIDEKDRVNGDLHDRVNVLEASVDASQQYGRRANLRIQEVVVSDAGEDACAKVLEVINSTVPKTHPAHICYVKYINIYNQLKQIAKTTYYANQLNTFKNDSKKHGNYKNN